MKALLAGDAALFNPPDDAEARLVLMAHRQMEAQAAEQKAKIDGLDRQMAQKEAECREIRAAIAKVEADIPLLTEQRAIRKTYIDREWGNRLTYLQVQQQLVEAQHDLEVQTQKGQETAQALGSLQQQRMQAQAEYCKALYADLAKAELSAKEHEQELAKAVQKRALRTLRAPVDGTVQQLAVHTLGGIVTPAQQLMVVVPKDTGLEIEATLPNKDVGFVHRGQPPGRIEPVTVDSKDAIPGTEDQYGQYAGRNLAALFPGNTLVETDGTLDSCLKGAEYYAPGGRLLSLGCSPKGNGKVGVDYSVWILRWRIKGGELCTTSRMQPRHFYCLTNLDQSIAAPLIQSKGGNYAPRIGRMAVQISSSENMPLLLGNVFHFR